MRVCLAITRDLWYIGREVFSLKPSMEKICPAQEAADRVAQIATRCLLYEVLVTPKPGLVDRANSGAHSDMDVFTFAASAAALFPYFARCAQMGMAAKDCENLLDALRGPGLRAEADMRAVTGGVNTHKGAIFSMGILAAAAGWLLGRGQKPDCAALRDACARIAGAVLRREMAAIDEKNARTAGEKLYAATGMTGVRGEAAEGFPSAAKALTVLEGALGRGANLNDACVEALLALLCQAQDSNFIKRASLKRREEIIRDIRAQKGSPLDVARRLDALFIKENISPGGCADLLAVALFFHYAPELV